jgi:hypothetical protein
MRSNDREKSVAYPADNGGWIDAGLKLGDECMGK